MRRTNFLIPLLVFFAAFINPAVSQDNFYDLNSVKEIRVYFSEHNWKHLLDSLFINYGEDGRLKGNAIINGKELYNVGVRYKGYSSWSSTQVKTPFNIDLEYNIKGQNYQGYTKLKLGNVICDPSFVREVITYEVARKYMPASKAGYANIYVNDTLIGLYTNVEAVDKIFAEKNFHSGSNTFFKGAPETLEYPAGQNANLAYSHGTDTTGYKPFYKQESANEHDWTELLNLIYILNNDTAKLDSMLNIDRTLWMHAINYAMVNLDSYIGYSQNYYIYQDDNGRFNPILWDLNMSFGSFRETDATTLNLSINKVKQLNPLKILVASTLSPRPLIKNILLNSTYKRMFLAHMRTIINENFRNGLYYTRGQEIQSLIDSYVLNDSNKFYSYDDFHENLDTITGPSSDLYPGIKDLMVARMAYLDTIPGFAGAPVITDISHTPEYPDEINNTHISAKVTGAGEVFLGYRFSSDGIFIRIPMYDDGLHNDGNAGDSIYGASIQLSGKTVQYYIYAQNDSAGIFSPERAEYEYYSIQPRIVPGDIVINEFMTANMNTAADQNGEYDSWIELFNTTNENLNLKTLFLSDDTEIPTKWAFPDTSLMSKNYLTIWADEDFSQTGLHANFKLSETSGHLFLFREDSTLIDSVTYGLQLAGKTYGRYPNGYGDFVYMPPSFEKYNYIGTTPSEGFLLYPNPANRKLFIEFPSDDNIQKLEIINSTGQKVMSEVYIGQTNTNSVTYSINIIHFHEGLYFLKAVTDKEIHIEKFIVVKN